MKTIITLGFPVAIWIACSVPLAAASASLHQAARAGDHAAVQTLLKNGADVQARDELGNTPLHIAAFCADADVVKLLLKAGAKVNATNHAGATPLIRAATFADKARLLVEAGADVHARSALGNTTIIIAARQQGNARTVKLLLDRGAAPNATNVFGASALMAAVAAEDEESVRLLLDRGADVNAKPAMNQGGFIWGGGRTPLMWAAYRGNEALVKLLLARGANVKDATVVGSALTQAGWAGRAGAAGVLLEAGAPVDQRDFIANYTPLHWAASSERLDPGLVELLLRHRADVNAEGGQPVDGFLGATHTPLQLARKRGDTPTVQALRKAGAREVAQQDSKRLPKLAWSLTGASDDALIAAAIQLALPPLQKTATKSAASFRQHASKQSCASCHQQMLPLNAVSLARSRRLMVDEPAARQTAVHTDEFTVSELELNLQATFHPEPAIGIGYSLFSLHFEKLPATAATDASMHQLAVVQRPDGSWAWNLPRPPIQSSDITATALAVQAVKNYQIPGRQREFERRIERARQWLAKAKPEASEERAYQLLGLAWAGERAAKLRPLAETLIREQRPDGGWGQLAKLPSDAYATGLSLYALQQAAGLPGGHDAVKRGIAFLLRTQLEDGTWHVRRRAFPFQPPMDSGFPHGVDGWISATATSWAVMALATAMDPSYTPNSPPVLASAGAAAPARAPTTAGQASPPVEFARDIQPLLERSCVACHSGERPKGGYQVVSRATFVQGGARGEPAVVAGHSSQSALLRLVADQVEDLEMPPVNKREKFPALTKEEIARLGAWVDQGAVWPEGVTLRPKDVPAAGSAKPAGK